MKKYLACVIIAAMAVLCLSACGSTNCEPAENEAAKPADSTNEAPQQAANPADSGNAAAKPEEVDINIGVLNGPTGVGAVAVMNRADSGEYSRYHFTLTPEPTDIVARLSNGDLDIGALPTNLASNLYNKTNGDIKIIALNCLGVLYILDNGNGITSVADLMGKTIYANGQGANPEYVLNHVLRQNGLEPGTDVFVEFLEASDITAKMISGDISICMLPVPAATTVMMKNPDVSRALDLTQEFADACGDGTQLTMGCLVATKKFIEAHKADVELFLERYSTGITEVLADVSAAAGLVAKYGLTGSAAIAEKAIPDCSLTCITGSDIKPAVEGYYKVLFNADPKAVGGKLPDDDIYYTR